MAERAGRGVVVPYLRQWRLYHALSQIDLAERSGASRPAIARAEAGAHFSFANIHKVAATLGISVQQLLHQQPGKENSIASDDEPNATARATY